jgi:hypothetical protein
VTGIWYSVIVWCVGLEEGLINKDVLEWNGLACAPLLVSCFFLLLLSPSLAIALMLVFLLQGKCF